MGHLDRRAGFVPVLLLAWAAAGLGQSPGPLRRDVVIHEIHYDPDIRTEKVEFVELFNAGTGVVDLSGWLLVDAVSFSFPVGTMLAPGGYLVVAEDPAALAAKFGVAALGPWTGALSNEADQVILCDAHRRVVDRVDYQLGFPWPTVGDSPGYSIELIHPGLDNDLGGNWRASVAGAGRGPTPGRRNAVFSAQSPPAIRQVTHSPQQPGSGQAVTITAKVTDPDGVAGVSLSYQTVDPGEYFSKDDAAYTDPQSWRDVAMRDDGSAPDRAAGDGLFAAQVPAGEHTHRRLIRYRLTAVDGKGNSVTVPYADDPQPNFAYFVYDGVPAWSGAIRPGDSDPILGRSVEYDFNAMPPLPVIHLITTRMAHEDSQHIPNSTTGTYGGQEYLWSGTLVCDGAVYDHIRYRARGGVWRYAMGKNMWKFDFNRGHEFQAHDEYGRPLLATWKKLNLGANIQQGDYGHRGEQGLFEYTGFKLYNLAGVPACITFPAHFRIIEYPSETNDTADNQYDDDFQGLYLAVEQMDGRFLDQHGLPDGNLYKMEGGGELNNQGPTQPSNGSDLSGFVSGYSKNPTESWWRSNFDLPGYYSFRAVTEAIHNGDIGYGKNYFYYHNPDTDLWSILPWDLDLTWAEGMYGNGDDPFKTRVLYTDKRYGDVREPFHAEYQGRLREIMDLLFKTEQVGRMIDEYVALVDRPSPGPSMVDADRALWDYNPILASPHVNPSKAGHGRFYQVAATKDFPGMARRMKDYVAFVYDHARNWMGDPGNGPGLVELAFDPLIPDTPVVTAIGPAGYPSDTLRFRTSPFSALLFPFKAMQWRIAEVTDPAAPMYDPEAPMRYEVEAGWTSGQISPFVAEVEIPAGVARPGCVYRVRCRMQDITDRWSHWSDPVQFTAGPPLLDRPRLALQVTEVMYHPAASVSEDGWDQDEFEFIEFMNIGPTPIDLFGVRLEGGVEFAFAGSAVTQLAPGAYVLVVENLVAFECRYGSALLSEVAGQYEGKLANGGEDLRVVDLQTGSLADFAYDDAWYPSTDGQGQSLVLVDPEHVDPGQLGQKASWRASARWGGSPGARDGP